MSSNNDKKYGRTFFDWISEHPIITFISLLFLLAIIIILVYLKVPFKVANVEVGEQKSLVHDTIILKRLDTVHIENREANKRLAKKDVTKISIKQGDTSITLGNQPVNINTGTNNGIIGNNGVINQAPPPTLELSDILYQDKKAIENINLKNKALIGYDSVECYKSSLRVNYQSDSRKDYIDFKINVTTILHVEMKKVNEIFTTSDWEDEKKIKGKRFYNPTNGIYEITFYTKYPIRDIWKFFRFYVNNKEIPIKM